LVIQPGAKIIARGTREAPIVFTSENPQGKAKPGDWGGVIVLGKAPINLLGVDGKRARGKVEGLTHDGEYGGDDSNDSSGVLEYVRIEYSGTELGPNNEVNGLTLAGVGRGTTIDHVQIRYPADDCFEFFGGTADAKHLICQHPGDDGIDWDYGYTGRIQFALVEQHPRDEHDGHGLEGDNDPSGSRNEPRSAPLLANLTLCGRGRALEKSSFAILVRRGTRPTVMNLVASGFSAGVDVRDPETWLDLRNASFSSEFGVGLAFREQAGASPGDTEDDDQGFDEIARFGESERRVGVTQKPILCSPAGAGRFKPESALTSGAAAPPADGFFDTNARFLGAFRDHEDGWDRGWTAPAR
jgi:hypothetical protein